MTSYQNLQNDCALTWDAQLAYDFEGLKVNQLRFFFVKMDGWTVGDSCKGDVAASFGPASQD